MRVPKVTITTKITKEIANAWYGKKCPDFAEGCACCEAHKAAEEKLDWVFELNLYDDDLTKVLELALNLDDFNYESNSG